MIAVTEAASVPGRAARDGWEFEGEISAKGAPLEDDEGVLSTWLSEDEQGVPLVTFGPGRVRIAITAIGRLGGDPAAFATSWARLFDRAAGSPAAFVEIEERLGVGGERWVEPTPPPGAAVASLPEQVPIEAWLSLVAGILAVLSWAGFSRSGAKRLRDDDF